MKDMKKNYFLETLARCFSSKSQIWPESMKEI